jgi:hypothetical protein
MRAGIGLQLRLSRIESRLTMHALPFNRVFRSCRVLLATVTLLAYPLSASQASPSQSLLAWTLQNPAARPAERWLHGATFDATTQRILVFGGQNGAGQALADTWTFDGVTWAPIAPSAGGIGPSARLNIGNALVHNPTTGQTLLFGGFTTQQYLSDTWLLDVNGWRNVSPAVSPTPRDAHAIAATGSKYVMWGGSDNDMAVWIFDGTYWFARTYTVTPIVRIYHSMVFDSQRNVVIMHGGLPAGSNGATTPLTDTWEFSETIGWKRVVTPVTPPGRWAAGMTYDSTRRRTILFGGSAVNAGKAHSDTWEYDGVTWRAVTLTNRLGPGERSGPSLVFDPTRNQAVLFGGRRIESPTTTLTLSETWTLAPPPLTERRFLPAALRDAPQPLREAEDNDTISTANALPLNIDLRGITDDTRDIFALRPETKGPITVSLSGLPPTADQRVQLQIFQGATTIANDTEAPYVATVPNPNGDYVVVIFTDKTNYPAASPYVLKAQQ